MTNKIRMDLNLWSYQDYVEFLRFFQAGNTAQLFKLAARLLVSWDYEVPLSEEDPLLNLSVHDSGEVLRTINQAIQRYIDDMDVSDVKVDFGKWNTKRLLEFDAARIGGKFEKAQDMLFEIAKLEGVENNQPLSFPDGSKMFKAVNDAYAKVISGKN